jgi:hypothetical protein
MVTLEGLSVPGIDAGYASATAARPPSVTVMCDFDWYVVADYRRYLNRP